MACKDWRSPSRQRRVAAHSVPVTPLAEAAAEEWEGTPWALVLAGMGYCVWAVNQRGYGRTMRSLAVSDYALPVLLDDVAALIDASGARSVVLAGGDWEAMVAWCFAAGRLRPLERLVIMNVLHPLRFRAALRH